jgi:hypothetical protein
VPPKNAATCPGAAGLGPAEIEVFAQVFKCYSDPSQPPRGPAHPGASSPGQLHAEVMEALKSDGPAIVDAVVAADELPNLPHIDLDKVEHYAVAKIKEALLAVTGR